MICAMATFTSKPIAMKARRELFRKHHLPTSVIHCEACDAYHLPADKKRLKLTGQSLAIMRDVAQGYKLVEIGERLGITTYTVKWYVNELRYQFGAMSTANLVVIFIVLGLINPNDFIPQLEEPKVREDIHGRNATASDSDAEAVQRKSARSILPSDGQSDRAYA